MTTYAERRRRRRRIAVTAVVILALLVAVVTGGLWLRSEAETRRAEAAKLLALAQLRQDEDPTEALAYTTASLELADTDEARVFAVGLLHEAPPALELEPGGSQHQNLAFSPSGRRLAVAGYTENVWVLSADGEGGEPPVILSGHPFGPIGPNLASWISEELLVTGHATETRARIWSFPGGRLVREIDKGGPAWWQVGTTHLLAEALEIDPTTGHRLFHLRSWRLPDGERKELGTVDWTALEGTLSSFDPDGSGWIYGKGNEVFYRPLPIRDAIPDRLVGSHENRSAWGGTSTEADRFWTRDAVTGELRQWSLSESEPGLLETIPPVESAPEGRKLDPSGRWAVHATKAEATRQARVWDLQSWPEARPLALRRSGSWYAAGSGFGPRGDWFVITTGALSRLTFWPLGGSWPHIVDGYSGLERPFAFSPDGRWLATVWGRGYEKSQLRLWPLPGNSTPDLRAVRLPEAQVWIDLVFDPHGRYVLLVGFSDAAYLVPLDGSPTRTLEGLGDVDMITYAAIAPSGQRVATAPSFGQEEKTLRVLDLDSGELELLDLPESSYTGKTGHAKFVLSLAFTDESTLYTAGEGGIHRWNLRAGANDLVYPTEAGHGARMDVAADGQTALVQVLEFGSRVVGPPAVLDLASGAVRPLRAFGGKTFAHRSAISLDASGAMVAASDGEGVIRAGRVADGSPHLLVGHEGPVESVDISPDGRWIASTGDDDTLRLWPMPNLDQAPLHTLPLDELLVKLKSLTNIRVVRDPESTEGWKVELGPFPGWAEVPTW